MHGSILLFITIIILNKYACFTDERKIILCTVSKNEDKYIDQWILYYLKLGIHSISLIIVYIHILYECEV